ncbi:MAG: EAL domain-containing protein [Thermotaleaceae bacterium]
MEQVEQRKLFHREFYEILNQKKITNVFQGIVSLKDGSILGYEALCRGPVGTVFEKPAFLFLMARETGKVAELEWLSKTKAVEKFDRNHENIKLFMNIDPEFFKDTGKLEQWMGEFFPPNLGDRRHVIFEVTEDTCLKDFRRFQEVLTVFKGVDCGIALDNGEGNFPKLNSMMPLTCPLFIKLDIGLIHDIHKDIVKQAFVKAQVHLANELNFKLIAEGIEKEEELEQLVELGVHYGQGYYIQRPGGSFLNIHPIVLKKIQDKNQTKEQIRLSYITTTKVGDISKRYPTVDSSTLGKEINGIFESGMVLEGLPVVDGDKPVGLIMKHKFYKNLGMQYGYVIFMKRSIDRIMDKNPLVVNYDTPLDRVSEMAMLREEESLYDYIIVSKSGKYFGIVTVKDLLQKTTEIQLSHAKYANPLTGLPGNVLIEQQLSSLLNNQSPYSVLYFDLDNFKAYNDAYGFENGDRVIEMTAQVIQQRIEAVEIQDSFLGHVGGDDFIAILPTYHIQKLCEAIIERFDKRVPEFYTETDRKNGFIMAENRHGQIEKFPLISLSIAVLNNERQQYESTTEIAEYASKVKKKCKTDWKSNYMIG